MTFPNLIIYKQKQDAGGSTFAEIIMRHIETLVIPAAPLKPKLYVRYVREVIIEWTHNEQELIRFKERLKELLRQ